MGVWVPLRSAFCPASVSLYLQAQAAFTAEEEECDRLIQTPSKADWCKLLLPVRLPCVHLAEEKSVCAAAVLPPGLKRSDCSVTNESLLQERYQKRRFYVPKGMSV